ncbi:transmembrane protein 268 [Microcaecilia unicolor]|uniref:Transmembrane protein 268 n=1 Tax=Microcaecilia unicolor TaxID=1415580 RepID=A0A6P7YJ57_9AMPH|nr:transmembrane protein 268 [Microcaecilia unicolor]
MACTSQAANLGESECISTSVSYSRSSKHIDSIQWMQELYNGQVLTVLRTQNDSSFPDGSMEDCVEKLKDSGIQIPLEEYKAFIQNPVLKPEIRRHMFLNSRAFGMVLAVIFYMIMWTNIYCILQMFSVGHHWSVSIFVSLCATVATIIIILILNHHQRKLNVNTDLSLAVVNETFMKYNVLVGVTDVMDGYQHALLMWFVYFNLERCLQTLSIYLAELTRNEQSALKYLKQLSILVETVNEPDKEGEEALLLSSKRSSKRKAFIPSEVVPLVPDGVPKVMAYQLLVLFSGCYIRLLVTSQLPYIAVTRHAEKTNSPCLCQFIEISTLQSGHCWL